MFAYSFSGLVCAGKHGGRQAGQPGTGALALAESFTPSAGSRQRIEKDT